MPETKKLAQVAFVGFFLTLLTLAAYWKVTSCDFISFDDDLYVTKNAAVQAGLNLSGMKWAFCASTTGNWHPLTWLSHMLDCSLFGLKPGGHHFVNLLFHTANSVLLFFWLWRLTGATWRSALVAALFAWHPIHVESVAWVSERKDVLSTFFWLLALIVYQKFKVTETNRNGWYTLSLALFAMGLCSKPMVVTLPFTLLLVDFWIFNPVVPWKRLCLEKVPFFAISGVSCVVTFLAQQGQGTMAAGLPFSVRLSNAICSYARYLGKLIWPTHLAVFYPFPPAQSGWSVGLALLILVAISILALKELNQRRYIAFGWFWFLGTLVPVIGLVQVGSQSMADRYAYVPSIGFFIMAAWGMAELAQRYAARRMAIGVTAIVLSSCLVLTRQEVRFWENSELLFKKSITNAGGNAAMFTNLAVSLANEGRIQEALVYLEDALRLNPSFSYALMNGMTLHIRFADSLMKQQRVNEAIQHYERGISLCKTALEEQPGSPALLNNLAWVLATNPNDAIRNGHEAVMFAERACEITGWEQPMLIGTLAAAYAENGEYEKAVSMASSAHKKALAAGETEIATKNEELLKLFSERKAYRY